jgi:hypothetical protein
MTSLRCEDTKRHKTENTMTAKIIMLFSVIYDVRYVKGIMLIVKPLIDPFYLKSHL